MRRHWGILVLVLSLFATLPIPAVAADTTSVTIAGNLQSALGCAGDWQPDCAATHLVYDTEDDVWQQVWSVPAANWEYKAAINDSWDENYGANATLNGANIGLSLTSPTDVKFYYDTKTHWVTDNVNSVIATAVGSFQSELGCATDWDPGCLRSWLQDPDGDGTYTFTTDQIPTGSYEAKVAINESWDLNYGAGGVENGANIPFTVPADGSITTFSYDSFTNELTIDIAAPYPQVTVVGSLQSELGCAGDWDPSCAETSLTPNDTDGVYRGTFTVPAGDWEYKAAIGGSWDENYGAHAAPNGSNIALHLTEPTEVTFYYPPETHWITDNVNSRIVTAVGNFQTSLGCSGDWAPSCLLSWLQDIDGDGVYTFTTSAIPEGDYEVKAAIGESWDENYGADGVLGGANIAFHSYGRPVTFTFISAVNMLLVNAETIPGIDNNVHWNELGHDSRSGLYRSPTGAVQTGTDVTLRLRAASGDLESASVRVWNDRTDSESMLPMQKVLDDGTFEWWQATLETGGDPTVYWYRFIARDGEAIVYYEDDDARTGGWGQPFADSPDNSWQLTVYDPSFQTPDWVKNAIVYQIFPDRFSDGDPSNDTPVGSFFYDEHGTIQRSDGTAWNTPICEPRSTEWSYGEGGAAIDCPDIYSQNFYGGDLQGIIDHLDYLQNLGVTAIYLNPIFESPSNHRYDTTDYLTIDDSLGDLDTFVELTTLAHRKGINIILDGVFNHTSSDSLYFDRYGRYSTVGACESLDSPYREWYFFSGDGPCAGDTGYTSWFGYDSLPKLNSANQEVRDLIYAAGAESVARYWLQWADGWRLDVAGDIDAGVTGSPTNDYWETFREAVLAANPDAYIVGEEWGNASPWLLGDEWDATMNYQFSTAVLGFFRETPFTDNDHNASSSAGIIEPLTPSSLWERLVNLEERYPSEAWLAMLNLLDSHDTNRALFMLDENAAVTGDAAALKDPAYDWSDAINRLEGVAILQMTLPGAPTIYYGDEVGAVGPVTYVDGTWQDDPYNRVPYPWLDATGAPFYEFLQSQAAQDEIRNRYEALTAARNEHAALRTGSLDLLLSDDASGVLAYGRWIDEGRGAPSGPNSTSDKADAAVVIVNSGDQDQSVELDLAGYVPIKTRLTDALSGDAYRVADDGSIVVDVPAGSGAVLVPTEQIASRPSAVDGVEVTGESAGSVILSWPSSGKNVEYDVYRSILSGGGYEPVGTTKATAYTDTGLVNGREYVYVIVARDTKTLLESGFSNEASGVPHYTLGWYDLQWPFSIDHTISALVPTETVYGQVWIDGATGSNGPADGVSAELGYGPAGSDPSTWTWTSMSYKGPAGNNDEWQGTMLPDAVGTYTYTVRWSTDGGRTWLMSPDTGTMEVTASSDTEAPTAPVLSVTATSGSSVSLEWTPSTDNVYVAGYEVFRDGVEIARTQGTGYIDTGVTTGGTYDYTVRAYDLSWNRSEFSDEVTATAEAVLVGVTFNVTAPASTPDGSTVYIAGSLPAPFPQWDPGATPLTYADGMWTITLTMLEGTSVEYKYTLGDWDHVEKDGSCAEIANRQLTAVDEGGGAMTVDDTVLNWRNVTPCGN